MPASAILAAHSIECPSVLEIFETYDPPRRRPRQIKVARFVNEAFRARLRFVNKLDAFRKIKLQCLSYV
jgi:hypothetical protein